MKKILCILLVAFLLMGNAFAEEFTLWHGYQFGMTKDEVIENSYDIDVILEGKSIEIKENVDVILSWSKWYDSYSLLLTDEDDNKKTLIVNEIANIPFVEPRFAFDDTEKMTDILFILSYYNVEWNLPGISRAPEVVRKDPQINELIQYEYDDLVARLIVKYGEPVSSDTLGLPQIDGIVTKAANAYKANGPERLWTKEHHITLEDELSWYVDIGDGNFVKIECGKLRVYAPPYLMATDEVNEYNLYWGYSYVNALEVDEALSIYDDL